MKNNRNLPRGLRNNNPGNIRIANNNWQGKVPENENTDGAFEQFKEHKGINGMVWGVRALTKLGWTYLKQNSHHTIKTFIEKYAPATENNTIAYAQQIAKSLGTTIDSPVKHIYENNQKQYLFILAIIKHENGIAYDNQYVSDGIKLGNQ